MTALEDLMEGTAVGEPVSPACPWQLMDSMLIQAAALGAGRSTMLFPGQALLVGGAAEGEDRLALAHGVPQQTQLSMATFVQDKRIRRALLEQHSFPVPTGATFSIGRGRTAAVKYAGRIGYPVVVKPMVGDSTVEVFSGVQDADELREVLRYFKTAAPLREGYEAASYAFTAIHTPKEGSTQARDTYRLLVEEQVHGEYLRFLLVDGEIRSAVSLPHGLRQPIEGEEVLDEVHETVQEFITRAAQVFAGLKVMFIDVILGTGRSTMMGYQSCVVVEVGERPWLYVQDAVSPQLSARLAGEILAAAEGRPPQQGRAPSESVSVAVEWQGVTRIDDFVSQLRRLGERLGASLEITRQDDVGGTAAGRIQGPSDAIALMNELAVGGFIEGERIMAVSSTPDGPTSSPAR